MQTAGELPDLLEARGQLVDGHVDQGREVIVRRLAQAPQGKQHRGDPLLGTVVEVALDAPALGVGDLDETGARSAQLGLDPSSGR